MRVWKLVSLKVCVCAFLRLTYIKKDLCYNSVNVVFNAVVIVVFERPEANGRVDGKRDVSVSMEINYQFLYSRRKLGPNTGLFESLSLLEARNCWSVHRSIYYKTIRQSRAGGQGPYLMSFGPEQ